MPIKSSVLAVVLATFAFSSGASATTIPFDFDLDGASSGTNVNLGGDFVADDLRIVSGNCNGTGGSCAALNVNETTTISRSSGLGFLLSSFWYQLLGRNAELTASYFDASGGLISSDVFSGPVDGHNDGGHPVIPAVTGEVFSVRFDDTNARPGNIRLDDFSFQISDPLVPLPAPGAGMLLISGFGGLAFLRRRLSARRAEL